MKNGYFHIEIMISAAHARGHAPQRENLEKMCNLVCLDQSLHYYFLFLSDLCIGQYDIC